MLCQAVFHYFFYDESKQDDATTSKHVKLIIELLQNRTVLFAATSNIWENTDGCVKQYHCVTEIHLLSILVHAYNIIIDNCIGELGHGIEVVDGLNTTNINFLSILMTFGQLPGAASYD